MRNLFLFFLFLFSRQRHGKAFLIFNSDARKGVEGENGSNKHLQRVWRGNVRLVAGDQTRYADYFFFLITLWVSTNGGMGWDLVSVWWIERGIGKD